MLASTGALALALVVGCGGGGGNGGDGGGGGKEPTGLLEGVNAQAAVGLADGKAAQIGMDVPFALVAELSPTPLAARARALKAALSTRGLSFLQPLGLYYSTSKSGSVFTMSFFTDAAGKTSAGSLKATSVVSGSENTYTVNGSVKGNIPITITNLQLAFAGTTDANTMSGEIDLTSSKIDMTLNLSVDASLNIAPAGSIKVSYNYAASGISLPLTTTLTNLKGSALTSITGDAAVSAVVFDPSKPSTGTGTGSFTPSTGDFSLTLTGGDLKGMAETYLGGKDTLTVQAISGQNLNFVNVASQILASLNTGSGTVTPPKAVYAAPIAIPGGKVIIGQALGDGEMVGFSTNTTLATTALYWATPTSTPLSLNPPTGKGATTAWGISKSNSQDVIVGSYVVNGLPQPCFWTRAGSGTSGDFIPHVATSVQFGAEFRAISANGNTIVGDSLDKFGVQHPMAYISGAVYQLPNDGRATSLRAIGVDNFNDIIGTGDYPFASPAVWVGVSLDQASNSIKVPLTPLVNEGISSTNLTIGHISPTGRVVGGTGAQADYWDRDTSFAPHQMSIGTGVGALAYGISDDGTKISGALSSGTTTSPDLGFWPTVDGTPVDISKEMATNPFSFLAGFWVLNDSSFIAISTDTNTGKTQFLYVKKN